jgi:hypothetical protein
MKKIIFVLAIIGVFCAASALACEGPGCPEQGQWTNQSWSFEFGDNYMSGSLEQGMGQWICPGGAYMQQNQNAYGNFHL